MVHVNQISQSNELCILADRNTTLFRGIHYRIQSDAYSVTKMDRAITPERCTTI